MDPTTDLPDLTSSGMFRPAQTIGLVPCCLCGDPIPPTRSNKCTRCMKSLVDITSGLPRHSTVTYCPDCNSYLHPPRTWIRADPESKQLLTHLLTPLKKLLPRLSLRLIHAEFIWTEPHSKRIKLKLKLQGQLPNDFTIIEQSHLIEYTVHDHLCDSCNRANANPDQWVAKVQLRQHVSHRRTFFYLEQLILKHRAADKSIRIQETSNGLDFLFSNRSHAVKFVDFINNVVPIESRSDKSLVSQDSKNNTYNYHHTFSVVICPICREDLICLPPELSKALGNLGPFVICTKVTNSLMLMDPGTLRTAFLDAEKYARMKFLPLLSSRQLVEYVVLDVEVEGPEVSVGGSRFCMAYAEVARVSDFGRNDNMFRVRTHLGHLLSPGDYALGYDLYGANNNDIEIDKYRGLVIPEAILIKKSYEEKRQRRRGKARPWKLKSLGMEIDGTAKGRGDEDKRTGEYEEFLKDLEENPELRFNISLYRNKEYQPSEMASTVGGDDIPSVPLDELLAELDLTDTEVGDAEGSDADSMME